MRGSLLIKFLSAIFHIRISQYNISGLVKLINNGLLYKILTWSLNEYIERIINENKPVAIPKNFKTFLCFNKYPLSCWAVFSSLNSTKLPYLLSNARFRNKKNVNKKNQDEITVSVHLHPVIILIL